MAAVAVAFDSGRSVQRCLMASLMDYGKVMARRRWLAQREDKRVMQREDDKRQCNNQLARRDDERAARREATQPRSLSYQIVLKVKTMLMA